MNIKNLKHLPEIVQFIDKNPKESFYEIEAPQFVTNIFVQEIVYPNWVKDWEDKDELLAQIESKDLMEPIKTMMGNADMHLISDEKIAEGTGYYYVHISFAVKPLPKHKGILKQDAVNLFLLPCEDENGKQQVKVMCSKFSFFGHFYQLKNAELLDVNSSDEIDQHYLQKLSEAVEIICNEFEITTDKNQGKFVKQIKEDPTKLLEEFIEITHAKDFNDEEGILEFKHHWDLIQKNLEEYKEIIVDEGYFDEDAEIDTHHFTKYLLSEFLCAFDTDWKMDHEELSEFISEEIGQDFKITYEETKQKPSVIVEKIEKESDFTMLNIDTQMDSYSFFICKKSEKEKILELSRKLSFPIEDAF